jgi:hypothetical protein
MEYNGNFLPGQRARRDILMKTSFRAQRTRKKNINFSHDSGIGGRRLDVSGTGWTIAAINRKKQPGTSL